jgi:ABC-type sugar transport system ATPase subunit
MRPQNIRLGTPTNNEVGFNGTVVVSEQLGDEQILAIRIGADEIRIAGIDPDLALAVGSQIEAAVGMDHLHFFANSE